MPTDQIVHRRTVSLVGNMNDIDASHLLEQLTRQMIGAPRSSRAERIFSRILLQNLDELGNILRGEILGYKNGVWRLRDECYRRQILFVS
jgi:hypothetical protein